MIQDGLIQQLMMQQLAVQQMAANQQSYQWPTQGTSNSTDTYTIAWDTLTGLASPAIPQPPVAKKASAMPEEFAWLRRRVSEVMWSPPS